MHVPRMIEARVTFDIMPGEVVGVPFGVWLHCDHDSGWGTAGAGGIVKATLTNLWILKWVH